jgi:hypothetical protein
MYCLSRKIIACSFNCFVSIASIFLVASILLVPLKAATAQDISISQRSSIDPRDDSSPWGAGSGAEWFSEYPRFNPLLKAAGIRWLRGFYEWQTIQPKQGLFNWTLTDRLVANAKANDIHLSYAFAYLAPWASADGGTRKFPIKNMQFWRDYVSGLVSRYSEDIKYWEVWNEFNGSFAENGTPKIYADLVREASISAKKIDPTAKIGMSVASFDVNFLDAVIKAGAANHFDFICVHPYEKLNALDDNGEGDFLTMASTLREMLAKNSQSVETPLWITEIGVQAPIKPDSTADTKQAVLLTKAYLLAIASGFQRVFWFEARGPAYNEQGDFGLIRADFTARSSYRALKVMSDILGPEPTNVGWINLGNVGYGFLFSGSRGYVLAAWAPTRQDIRVTFDSDVQILDLVGNKGQLSTGREFRLTNVPQFIVDVPSKLVEQAKANRQRPFPWGKEHSQAQVVSATLKVDNVERGLRQINPETTVPVTIGDQSWRRADFSKPGAEGHYVYFSVAPQFIPFGTTDLEIVAVVRRAAADKVSGMSLDYESQRGYVGASYFGIPADDEWHELKWKISDADFVGKWGWNFRLSGIASPNEFLIREVRVKKSAP